MTEPSRSAGLATLTGLTGRAAIGRGFEAPGRRSRRVAVTVAAVVIALTAALIAVTTGTITFPLSRVLPVLWGGGDEEATLVIGTLRLPRVVTGLAVGAGLAAAGALTQTVARNPLASPDILGVTSGASVGAVAVVILAGGNGGVSGWWQSLGVPTAAVVGGLLAALVVAAVARSTERIILVGVGVSAAATSIVAWLLVIGDVQDAGRAAAWLAGSLNGRAWSHVIPLLIGLAVAVVVCVPVGRSLAVIGLGDDVARSLGSRLSWTRAIALVVATVLAGLATAAAGPIAFIGLAAPQLAMRLTRSERPPLLTSAVVGAALVSVSDLVARHLFGWISDSVTELPVGIVTAVLGATYLAVMLTRKGRLG